MGAVKKHRVKAVYDDVLTEMYESGLFRLNKQNRVEFYQRWSGHLYVPANWYLCGRDDGKGYLYISYGQARVKEHRLVYMFHHRVRNLAGLEINHINGDTLDNSIENLELCEPPRQSKHAFDTGLNPARGRDREGES